MKRFMILGVSAGVCLVMFFAASDAQEKRTQIPPIDKAKNGPKYAVPDLAVIDMSGAYDGTNFNVGGTVKNVGHGDYRRTGAASGAIEARQIQLYAVSPSAFGRSLKLLRTLSVPALKVNETWSTGSMKISPHDIPGTGNPCFVLILTKGDANRDNDSKQISVSFVR